MEPLAPSFAIRAGRLALMTLPFLIGVICVLLSFVPFGMVFGTGAAPAFGLMAVYYWGVTRPEVFPPYAVFAIGVLFDLLSAGPIGLWSLVYVLTYGVTLTQRMLFVGRGFGVFWMGFAAAAVVAGALAWAVASLYYYQLLSPGPVAMQLAVTVAFFPLFAPLFGQVQRRLLPQV